MTRRSSGRPAGFGAVELDVSGLSVKLRYKRVRSISIRVKPPDGRVEASAPPSVLPEEVAALVRAKRAWIDAKRAEIRNSPSAQAEGAPPEEVARWRAVVEASAPALVERWESALGVRVGKLVYRNMKSRWGSCQPTTGRICINVRLALYPPECLEYVVVHELAHLRERGHGPAFAALMDAALPDWRDRRSKLR